MSPIEEIKTAGLAGGNGRLSVREDGALVARIDGEDVPVTPARCFPWSHGEQFYSLRNDEGHEVALVEDPDDLDGESRAALASVLAEIGFVFEVRRVLEVEEEFEIRCWKVETGQGPRTFQTARDEWPRETPDGSLLVRDVAGDLYRIPDIEGMDAHSQRLLWALVD